MSDVSDVSEKQNVLQRRRFLQGAALTLVTTTVMPISASAASTQIVAEDYWAQKGAVKLYLYRKRLADGTNAGAAQKPVLFLVHGSSFSGRGGFVPQGTRIADYSFMDQVLRY